MGLSDAKIKKLVNLFIEPILIEKEDGKDGQILYQRRKVSTILQSEQNVFIIGESGCGKSTLFRELAKQVIEQNGLRNDYELYPIITTFNQIKKMVFLLR